MLNDSSMKLTCNISVLLNSAQSLTIHRKFLAERQQKKSGPEKKRCSTIRCVGIFTKSRLIQMMMPLSTSSLQLSLILARLLKDRIADSVQSKTLSSSFFIPTRITQRFENHMQFNHPYRFEYANSANLITVGRKPCLLPPLCSTSKNLNFCLSTLDQLETKPWPWIERLYCWQWYRYTCDDWNKASSWYWCPCTDESVEIGTLCPTRYRVIHIPRSHSAGGGVNLELYLRAAIV